MTSVAYRDGVLAADSLITTGSGHRDGYCVKIAKRGPFLASVCGSWPIALSFLDWFRHGLQIGKEPRMEFTEKEGAIGHVYMPTGRILTFSNLGWSYRFAPYYAEGTGGEYCYGAMARGATAEEAVRVACEFDSCSGGDITVLRSV